MTQSNIDLINIDAASDALTDALLKAVTTQDVCKILNNHVSNIPGYEGADTAFLNSQMMITIPDSHEADAWGWRDVLIVELSDDQPKVGQLSTFGLGTVDLEIIKNIVSAN